LIIAILVAVPIIAYETIMIIRRIKKRDLSEDTNIDDRSYNMLKSTESLVNIMKERGYDVSSLENMLVEARSEYSNKSYAKVIGLCSEVRRLITRLNAENLDNAKSQEISPQVQEEIKKVAEIKTEDRATLSPTYELKKKFPENYLSAKFSINMVESKINNIEDQNTKNAALQMLEVAKKDFAEQNYTEALRYSVKADKIIENEKAPEVTEDEEILRCSECGSVIKESDKYCWNCGTKIVFQYLCPVCHKEVKADDKYCRNCGAELSP
jgi:RNA polymerase subunit RPABC4/transcription elongation factor Spt4